MHTNVTCQECLKRQRTIGGKTFRERYCVGDPSRMTGKALARGHAMYRYRGDVISLCVAHSVESKNCQPNGQPR